MKTTNLKWIAYFLSVLMLLQSCAVHVYDKNSVSVDEAIAYNNRVKAKTFVDVTYEFDDLIREEGQLYGITKRNSKTAKKLIQQIVDENYKNKYVKMAMLENTIKSYHLKNKNKSTIKSVMLNLLTLGAFIGISALILRPSEHTITGNPYPDIW